MELEEKEVTVRLKAHEIHEYDAAGHEVHYKNSNGKEWWREYDANGNEVHYRDTEGMEEWGE